MESGCTEWSFRISRTYEFSVDMRVGEARRAKQRSIDMLSILILQPKEVLDLRLIPPSASSLTDLAETHGKSRTTFGGINLIRYPPIPHTLNPRRPSHPPEDFFIA